ncbi:MAG: histidine phosphatase family protein [Chthoniobacterales bacterium]
MKTLYLVRHGETDHNADGRAMGQMDVPLNARGLAQARQTGEFLRRYPIERIVSSDLQRATATAQPLADALGLAVESEARLRELSFGILEGKTVAECEAIEPEAVARWGSGDFDVALPGGESRRSLMRRTRAVLDEILAGPHDHIALFSHGGALNALHTHILEHGHPAPREHIPRAFRFHNAAVSMAAYSKDQWRFLVVNSTFHLEEEARQLLY